MESRLTQVLFFVWGTVVFVLHMHAESISGLPQCQMQVKPWFSNQPSCSLLVLDCYASNFTGSAEEITAQWNDFDPKTPACVAIRHCSQLEVPPILTQFTQLKVLKVYNSTIESWDDNAAITETHHPNLIMLFLVRVNMTDGELPPGLQGDELPRSLSDIEFCVTNLRALPDNFDLKWPQFAIIYFEASNFTEVPPALARLAPYDLSLALNPISSIPAKLFDGDIRYLHVGGTLISALPQRVTGVSHSLKLRVDNTNVSFFWDWIDPVIEKRETLVHSNVPNIIASNSPYCLELQRIYDGKQVNLSVVNRDGLSQILSNASEKNWARLKRAVLCDQIGDGVMTKPVPRPISRATEYVRLSFRWFAMWWVIILGVHIAGCGYNVAYAKFYHNYGDTFLSYTLEANRIGLPRQHFPVITYVYMSLAAVHGMYALLMIIGSARNQTLTFSSGKLQDVPNIFSWLYEKFAGRRGLLGVNGRHFDLVIICREVLQTLLQTIQAVRMSKYLPRATLNRFYVCLVAINCWSSSMIYSRWFWKDEARRRFAVILFDVVLNLVSALGVPFIIVMSYLDLFHADAIGFDFSTLGDEEWVAQLLNEVQMVIVISWFDLMSRVVFTFGLVASCADLKDLLCSQSTNVNHVYQNASLMNSLSPLMLPRLIDKKADNFNGVISSRCASVQPALQKENSYAEILLQTPRLRKFIKTFRFGSAIWGIVIVILHIIAVIQPALFECATKVHPMAGVLPSCYIVNFNCHALRITGRLDETLHEWNKFDHKTTMTLRILHCPALEIPASFQNFPHLQQIVVYNSTIVDWSVENAIISTNHPDMIILYVVRVNMTGGMLPPGLQSLSFPPGSGIYLENSRLTEVAPALAWLKPVYLIMNNNPITKVSPEIFEGVLNYLTLGGTKLTELPQNVAEPSTALYYLDITDTDVTFFWAWMDPLVEDMFGVMPLLSAGGSLYCSDLDSIMSGKSSDFRIPFEIGYSPLLMNASEENWGTLLQAVDCSPPLGTTHFPLESWDKMYGIELA
ncbi:Hypothetical protein PHPALM_9408 [Phytophthora palmivora]|uniref:Leucine-rich repeat domain, L domain-like n=1 Tax=Phytophthora palmivora TaxID=4796 RepID=A0A2P4Y7D3_9STRA|nr:Hypothetical protein PHPALM_9408 [Phytophthora palmivora]